MASTITTSTTSLDNSTAWAGQVVPELNKTTSIVLNTANLFLDRNIQIDISAINDISSINGNDTSY